MKNLKLIYKKIVLLLILVFIANVSCERPISDEVEFARFPATGDIFTDTPIGLGSDFYFPYGGSKPTAWSVDDEVRYLGTASMRFDVPNADDPLGTYAGAIFRIDGDGSGRDLSGFDALTFWAKASQGVTIGEIGFGEDFGENKYVTTKLNLKLTTNWVKYIIPIPDASKLTRERGMLRYAAGTQQTGGLGYTFWLDEVKFEKLGTIAQPRPAILNGVNKQETAFTGVDIALTGLTQTFSLDFGNTTVVAAPSYFTFKSSNQDVAIVNEAGMVKILTEGTSKITASLGGVLASGSLEITSTGGFDLAPIPTRLASNVISIFSDTYTNVPVDFFNGFWEPFQTTESSEFAIEGNNMISYTNFNFVGNQFSNPTVDATQKPNVHINMYIPNNVPANMDFLITLVDFGADKADGGGDDTRQQVFFNKALFVPDTWITLEFPITMANKNNMGLIIYENINGSSLRNFYLDNIYFYGN